MDEFRAFILPVCGIFWAMVGGWWIFRSYRSGSQLRPATVEGRRPYLKWLDGIVWLCVGIALICFSEILPLPLFSAFGVLCVVLGMWQILSTIRRNSKGGEGPEPALELPEVQEAEAVKRLRGRRFLGMFWLGVGIATVCFSGIRVFTAPATVSQRQEESNRLAEIVTQHVEQDFAQKARIGMVVGAVANGEEVLLGFGQCRLGESQAPDGDTVFEIGSISKVFTGILLAKRVEGGELELDDRIADLLPEGWSLSEEAGEVTLRHCTTHTSGFPRLPANWLGVVNLGRGLFGGDPYRGYSEDQFRDALGTVELEFEPGAERRYSNFAVGLLGFVLATQNGSDYETLLRSEICQPLGMDRTVITSDERHLENMPGKYRGALRMGPLLLAMASSDWQLPNHLAGAGAIRSTGRDMMKFLKANMGLTSTDLDAAIRRSHQELYKERASRAGGMNWMRSLDRDISKTILWHNGGTGGFRTYLGFTEDRQIGVVVLSNTSASVDDLGKEIIKALVRDPSHGGQKPVGEDGFAKVAPYTGVRREDGRPIVCVQARWLPLVSIDGIPIDRIMEFAEKEFGDRARKRLAEDLVELLAGMGHEPDREVTLGLRMSDGQVEHLEIVMTEENRNLVRE